MPDLSTSQLTTDMESIFAALPDMVQTVTISGTSLQALQGTLGGDESQEDIGRVPTSSRRLMIKAVDLTTAGITLSPRETEVTLGGTTYLLISTQTDPFGAYVQLTIDDANYYME